MDTLNLLMTGAGAPGAAGIIKCLRQNPQIHIIGVDANPDASGKLLTDTFYTIPDADHPGCMQAILDIAIQKNVKIILPLVTRELQHFAKHADAFTSAGITLLCSDLKALEIANNKAALYQHLLQLDIPVPDFHVVQTLSAFHNAIIALGHPEIPVCFKPSVSNGSRGFRIIRDDVDELDLLFHHKPNQVYISSERILNILGSGAWPELLVCEYLPGDEYSIDCVVMPGKPHVIVPRKRTRITQGISTAGVFENHAQIIEYCMQILDAIPGLYGNIGIQVKMDTNNLPKILEINPRVQGTIVAALGAGMNLPLLSVYSALDMPLHETLFQPVWGTRFVRVWQELFMKPNAG
jgi:carbamoyl-phosphate synthase large subunit